MLHLSLETVSLSCPRLEVGSGESMSATNMSEIPTGFEIYLKYKHKVS